MGLTATILLGALGSGLWELALKPLGRWLGKSLLTVATLGSNSVRDDIYREAAKGIHEASSLQLFWLVVLSMSLICWFAFGYAFGQRGGSKANEKFMESVKALSDEAKLAATETRLAVLKRQLSTINLLALGFACLFVSIQFIDYLKLLQANSAYTFFAQSMAICVLTSTRNRHESSNHGSPGSMGEMSTLGLSKT